MINVSLHYLSSAEAALYPGISKKIGPYVVLKLKSEMDDTVDIFLNTLIEAKMLAAAANQAVALAEGIDDD